MANKWNLNLKFHLILLFFFPIYLLGKHYLDAEDLKYFNFALVGLFFLSLLVELFSFFSKYESTKGKNGVLKIDTQEIIWNKKNIPWTSVSKIEIKFDEINNQLKWKRYPEDPKNHVSDGYNPLTINTTDGNQYQGHYRIQDLQTIELLKKLLWDCVAKNHLSYDIAKMIVKPKSFEEHQILKQKLIDLKTTDQ